MRDASRPRSDEPAAPAWDTWHAAHRDVLRGYLARSLGRDRDLAEDLLQEVWARAVAHGPRLPADEDPRAWLFRVATNLLIDHHRKRAFRKEGPMPDGLAETRPDREPDPEARALGSDLRRRLRDAIAKLPDAQREVFLLREYAGVPFKDIAVLQDAPMGTVLGRMRLALLRLRAELGDSP